MMATEIPAIPIIPAAIPPTKAPVDMADDGVVEEVLGTVALVVGRE
jgi:hypothetical protein